MNTGSDLSLGKESSVAVVFSCDGECVTFYFRVGEKKVGESRRVTRKEAVEIGKQVAETGIYDQIPISDLSLEYVKGFGWRLREYGENGR